GPVPAAGSVRAARPVLAAGPAPAERREAHQAAVGGDSGSGPAELVRGSARTPTGRRFGWSGAGRSADRSPAAEYAVGAASDASPAAPPQPGGAASPVARPVPARIVSSAAISALLRCSSGAPPAPRRFGRVPPPIGFIATTPRKGEVAFRSSAGAHGGEGRVPGGESLFEAALDMGDQR